MSSPQNSDIGVNILLVIIPISVLSLIICCINCKTIYKNLTELSENEEVEDGRIPETSTLTISNKNFERENNISVTETDEPPTYSEVFSKVS